MTAIFLSNGCKPQPSVTDEELQIVLTQLSDEFARISPRVVRPAEGFLKYPYLIPAGFYQQMWDWDGYFMGTWFIGKGQPEYMQYWALNFLEGMDENGYVAGCMTTEGPRVKRGTFFMKPFLSQGVLRASQAMGDFEWVRPYYERLCRVLAYRDATQRDEATGLYFWEMAFQSGADNNPALNYFSDDKRSFLACDCSAMQLLEFRAQAEIAAALGMKEEARTWNTRAEALASAIQHLLWCAEDQCYYNVDRETGDFYRRVSYSSFWPLYAGLAPQTDGQAMIRRYLLSEQHMRSPHGLRSLSASDPDYNNKNIILPFSNWQGPIWIPALVVYAGGMLNYGFKEELRPIAVETARLLLKDLDTFDTMHENYHAETGEGLAPAPDYVDADGRFIGFISWNLCAESVLRSCQ
jgi:alpha,alpha-trehalase